MTARQIAQSIRAVHFGGNWTDVNLKDVLKDVSYLDATRKVAQLNTIAAIVFHINYFIAAVIKVMEGGPLDAHDKYSFDHPPINSDVDWQSLLEKIWIDAQRLAELIEALPDESLWEDFDDGKYGNNYYNLQGIIEHTHYHVGQIVLIKRLLNDNLVK